MRVLPLPDPRSRLGALSSRPTVAGNFRRTINRGVGWIYATHRPPSGRGGRSPRAVTARLRASLNCALVRALRNHATLRISPCNGATSRITVAYCWGGAARLGGGGVSAAAVAARLARRKGEKEAADILP